MMTPSSSSTDAAKDSQNRRWFLRALYLLPWLLIDCLLISLITCWKRFANDYLHIGALVTWLIFTIQGKCAFSVFSMCSLSLNLVQNVHFRILLCVVNRTLRYGGRFPNFDHYHLATTGFCARVSKYDH